MRNLLLASLIPAAAILTATPAHAQSEAKAQSVIVVYGDDECPQAKDGEEIVVCARRPESERYRVPKRFRKQEVAPGNANESWAVRSEALNDASPVGISKCSTIGPAGWTGCYAQFLREAAAQRRAQRRAEEAVPSAQDKPLPDAAIEDDEGE